MARNRQSPQLKRYVRTLREAKANGRSIDALLEVALGPDAIVPEKQREAGELGFIIELYRESIGRLAR